MLQRRENLSPHEAIYQACLLRFRPIMMTTIGAILGALPLAIGLGEGSELRQPLGISIVGGLLVSQVLTLYTTPVVYLYLDRFGRLGERRLEPLVSRHHGRDTCRCDHRPRVIGTSDCASLSSARTPLDGTNQCDPQRCRGLRAAIQLTSSADRPCRLSAAIDLGVAVLAIEAAGGGIEVDRGALDGFHRVELAARLSSTPRPPRTII